MSAPSSGRARWGVASIALALWALAGATPFGQARALSSPAAVARAAIADTLDLSLPADLAVTLARALSGAVLAGIAGTSVGLALGLSPRARAALGPAVDFVRSIPPILVYPLFLLSLGYGEGARLAAVTFGAFGLVALPVAGALDRAPPERRAIVRLARLSLADTVRLYALPEALPAIVTGFRLALAQSLVITVVTEMLVSPPRGLGVRALSALQEYRPERLWLAVLVAGSVSAALNAGIRAIERRSRPWETEPQALSP